jgi:flagellar assembly protein FliH
MARIYNSRDARQRGLEPFDRDRLEQFSEEPLAEFELPPPLVPQQIQGHAVDHGELREALLAELRSETQTQVEQAYQEGHRRGYAAGHQEFMATTAQAGEMLEQAAAAMVEAREQFLQHLEPQVLDLVTLVCRKVLDREIRCDAELLQHTVRRALTKLADQQKLVLRVHPDDLEALRRHRVQLLEEFEGVEELDVQPDSGMSPGGCVVESSTLHVDARLEVLLENVLEALKE